MVDAGRAAVELWQVYRQHASPGILARRAAAAASSWRQLHAIGNKSLLFIVVTLGFIGMVMTYEACLQLARVTGDFSQVGSQYIRLIVSDFGPTLTGLMLATRVGAGIAAEIGSMKVTEQIDALRMSGVLPIDYLIVPRFLASLVMTLMLTVLGGAVMYGAGGLTAQYSFGVNPQRVLRPHPDPAAPRRSLMCVKAVSYGAAIPVVVGVLRAARARQLARASAGRRPRR